MKKSRILSAVLSTAMLASCFTGFSVSAAPAADDAVDTEYAVLSEALSFDFTSMSEVPAYSAETGSGFVGTTTSVASFNTVDDSDTSAGTGRTVAAVEEITLDGGAKVTESDNEYVDGSDYNYGGLAFRVNVEPGMYNVKVEGIDGTTKDNTAIAVSGMQASRLTGTGAWDSAGLVAKTGYAKWTDNVWSYDFVAGEGFIEVEVEPAKKPTADAPQTVGVKSITITPVALDEAGDKPTVFVLGDSTQKTYTFEENSMSGYGQTLYQMFDLSKVNVVNYSMGGRSMKANYQEGRFNDVLDASKPGDYVFIHSAHNDESTGTAGPAARFGRGSNEATYKNWLYNVYIPSMKAMGVTPVLVSSMPRLTGSGAPRDYFTPNSPVILKEAAETVDGVEFVDLFSGAIDYLSAVGTEEAKYIYMSIEAGETAGKTNSGSYANGHPDNKIDGTHYKEAAAKQWSRIIAQDIYAQKDGSLAGLADLLADNVKAACEDGNWTEHVFPEMANDVSTIGNTSAEAASQGENAYYRNQIEKMLQLGVMAKDSEGNFNPSKDMTVGSFAKALTKLWDLDEAVLSEYMSEDDVDVTTPPVEVTTAPDGTIDAVKIVAAYDADGRLTGVTTEDIKYDGTVEPIDGAKVFVWESLKSMKPAEVKKAESASLSAAGDVTEWVVSSADAGAAEGTELMPGLTMLFTDEAGTGTYLSTSGSNGKFANGAITGTAMKFVAPEDGVLTVTFSNVGANKETIIVSEGTTDKTAAEFYEFGASVAEAFVKGGTTYYTSVLGSKGRFVSVKFVAGTPATPPPTATPDPNATPEPELVDYTPISGKAALTREAMAAIVYDAYLAKFGKAADGSWNKPVYMTNYNGTTVSPDDPEYDPNLTGKEAQYYPLVGWGVITDKESIAKPLYAKVKEVYNLGLMRSEAGIARGSMKNGTEMEPTVIVTRAKAAKELYFLYNLIQNIKTENQVIPGENMAFTLVEELAEPDYTLPRFPGGDEVEPTPVPTPEPTERPAGVLPEDIAWTVNDTALNAVVVGATGDGTPFGPHDGLSGYGGWTNYKASITYTHTNGVEYTFTQSWRAGSGNATKRSLYFTPEEACIVTVPYTSQAGRPVYIYQNGELLASGEEGAVNGVAATITADIEDPSKGDVYVWGGSSNKDIFGIFVDYYDPNVIVNRTVSGNVNYSGAADKSALKIVFKDTKDGTEYKTAFAETYSVEVRQNRSYEIYVEENGVKSESVSTTLDTNAISIAKMDKTFDIDVVDIALTTVTGDVVVHDILNDGESLDLSKVQLTFTAKDNAEFTYTTGIANNKINLAMMPNHEYTVTATGNDGYALSELSGSYLMAAGDTAPFKNVLFTEILDTVEFASTVEVGADKAYATIGDAITAIKKMTRPAGEAGRVEVAIDPGIYTEQIQLDANYVTLKAADEAKKPEVQWYYGIGYLYYSSAGSQYYSEDWAVQKTKRGTVTRWGAACRITGQYAILENIIFRNTFNCEVTEAEIADGVAPAMNNEYSDTNGKPDRLVEGYDPRTKAATERAAAFAGDAANYECYRCEFISSQDTLYTNYNGYFKECYIEGGTDYIFGGNSIVFDECTLAWHGYSDQQTGGYISACKTSSAPSNKPNLATNGYLFKDCTVTTSKYYTENQFAAGGWGRNWGGEACQVVFLNTKMDDAEVPGAWVKMGGELSTSVLYIDGVTDKDGNAVDTSGTGYNPNGTMAANGYTVMSETDYFGSWVPKHYTGDLPDPTAKPEGVSVQLTNLTAGTILTADEVANKTAVSFGLDAAGNRVAVDSADAVIVFENAKYHSEEHGINYGSMKIPVTGVSEIKFGTCAWGSDVTVKDAAGEVVATFTSNNGTCYHNNTVDNVAVAYYRGEATTLTITGGSYLPFISVMKIDAADIPNEATVKYELGTSGAAGEVPAAEKVDIGTEITIPLNRTLYLEGSTLTGWTDGTNTYAPGTAIKLTEDLTLTPIFAANTAKLGDAATTVAFDFQRKNGTPVVAFQNKTAILVYQATIGDAVIDIKMDVDTTSGKLANGNWSDWAQVNAGTKFVVPAMDGCIVTMDATYGDGNYTINGTAYTQAAQAAGEAVTISGEETVEIVAVDPTGSYWRGFTVAYPAAE